MNVAKDIWCKTKDDSNSVFCVKVSCNEIPLITRPSCQVPNYLISIHSPLIFNNQLPFVIDVNIPTINYELKIEPGERINMHSLNCNSDTQFVFKVCILVPETAKKNRELRIVVYRFRTIWARTGLVQQN